MSQTFLPESLLAGGDGSVEANQQFKNPKVAETANALVNNVVEKQKQQPLQSELHKHEEKLGNQVDSIDKASMEDTTAIKEEVNTSQGANGDNEVNFFIEGQVDRNSSFEDDKCENQDENADSSDVSCFLDDVIIELHSKKGASKRKIRTPRQSVQSSLTKTKREKDKKRKNKSKRKLDSRKGEQEFFSLQGHVWN